MALANAQLAFARRAGIAQALRSQRVISFEAPFCSISEPDSCAGITGAIAATRDVVREEFKHPWSTFAAVNAAAPVKQHSRRLFNSRCFSSLPAGDASADSSPPASGGGLLTTRYQDLLDIGTLKPDPLQAETITRLQQLSDELSVYKGRIQQHNLELEAYQARKQKLVTEMEKKEKSNGSSDAGSGGGAWLMGASAEGSSIGELAGRAMAALGMGPSKGTVELTPEQKARLAARKRERKAEKQLGPPPTPPEPPTGVYIYGSVGSGKSLVMDLFYETVVEQKLLPFHRRVHFNAAMLEMHQWLTKIDRYMGSAAFTGDGTLVDHEAIQGIEDMFAEGEVAAAKRGDNGRNAVIALRRATRAASLNPQQQQERLARSNASVIRRAARAVIRNHLDVASLSSSDRGQPIVPSLLCFDEMQVTDVFAAVALKGLLEVLTSEGTVMVMTSNRATDDLNNQGLNEDLFDHFVTSLQARTDSVQIAGGNDYRKLAYSSQRGQEMTLFHSPLGEEAERALKELWGKLATEEGEPTQVEVMFGRHLQVPQASACGSARFSFSELCARPLGAADYIAIARNYHTVFLTDIPSFSMQIRDQARRFITLVDELYNHRVRLVCSAQDTPDRLFIASEGSEEAILDLMDLEGLQSETAVQGGGLRRDVLGDGGVAPVASTKKGMSAAMHHLGGMEEKFAFKRAVSRMYEMQTDLYLRSRSRGP